MSSDHRSDESIDVVLSDQPVWVPPPRFASRVTARTAIASRQLDERVPAPSFVHAALAGVLVALAVYVAGSVLTQFASEAAVNVPLIMDAYGMLLTRSVGELMTHSTAVALISAGISIGVGLLARPR